MALLDNKDVDILLNAGFDESELGLVEGGKLGIQIFETPNSYFANELIDNACEQGECTLYDEIIPYVKTKEPYDTSRPRLWDNQEYAGNEDPLEDVEPNMREQIEFLLSIKVGRMSIWQGKDKNGNYRFPVSRITVEIPEDEKERLARLEPGDRRQLWISFAKDEWKKCWQACIDSIWSSHIIETRTFKTKKGKTLNMLVISADSVRNTGYKGLPSQARWITMIYFEKDNNRRR